MDGWQRRLVVGGSKDTGDRLHTTVRSHGLTRDAKNEHPTNIFNGVCSYA
jgi:hypothetical protein